eukprot:9472479-Pyramimonas_sp.AAC.2
MNLEIATIPDCFDVNFKTHTRRTSDLSILRNNSAKMRNTNPCINAGHLNVVDTTVYPRHAPRVAVVNHQSKSVLDNRKVTRTCSSTSSVEDWPPLPYREYVFPVPVWPNATIVALKPSRNQSIASRPGPASKSELWLQSGGSVDVTLNRRTACAAGKSVGHAGSRTAK